MIISSPEGVSVHFELESNRLGTVKGAEKTINNIGFWQRWPLTFCFDGVFVNCWKGLRDDRFFWTSPFPPRRRLLSWCSAVDMVWLMRSYYCVLCECVALVQASAKNVTDDRGEVLDVTKVLRRTLVLHIWPLLVWCRPKRLATNDIFLAKNSECLHGVSSMEELLCMIVGDE